MSETKIVLGAISVVLLALFIGWIEDQTGNTGAYEAGFNATTNGVAGIATAIGLALIIFVLAKTVPTWFKKKS